MQLVGREIIHSKWCSEAAAAVTFTKHTHNRATRAQRLINLEIPVLVQSLKSSNIEIG